jgi:hypothetical protein
MAEPDFDSVEAIRKFYGKQIKDAEDEAKPALQLAQAEAIATFSDRRAAEAERKVWIRDALDEFPPAKQLPELVTGNTEDEIKASAKAVAERVTKMTAASNADDDAAKKLYGPTGTNGGGAPPPPRSSENAAFVKDFEQRFNDPNGQYSTQEVERYAKILSGTNVVRKMAQFSQHFERAGITPEVVEKATR